MTETLLRIDQVSKRFGGLLALKDVSFSVSAGSATGIIGPNGSGKSTLFENIAGAQRPTNGQVFFKGQDVTYLPAHRRCGLGIGRTFQMIETLGNMTVFENVLVAALLRHGGKEAHRRTTELLRQFGLIEHSHMLARVLNASEQRRVDLARALATDPTLLLLDEPLAGLTREEIGRTFANLRDLLKSGLTIIIIEHRLEALFSFVSHVVALDAGEVIGTGSPEEVQRNDRVIAAYLGTEVSALA